MRFTDFLNPLELLDKGLNALFDGFRAHRGFRLLVFGTTGVGKSTFWYYLENEKIADPDLIKSTTSSTKVAGGLFRLKGIKLSFIKVGIRAIDIPGNTKYRNIWAPVLNKTKPHGIIFLLDNVAGRTNNTEKGYDEARLQEHKEAFRHLVNLIQANEGVAKNLQALLILANKVDIWPDELTFGDLLDQAGIYSLQARLHQYKNLRMMAGECSALHGENIIPMVEWMVKNFR